MKRLVLLSSLLASCAALPERETPLAGVVSEPVTEIRTEEEERREPTAEEAAARPEPQPLTRPDPAPEATPEMLSQRDAFDELAAARRQEACFERDPTVIDARMAQLAEDDRADAVGTPSAAEIIRNSRRRDEVMKLFSSGCLQTSEDYGRAAQILQRGRVAEHYLSAFIFALEAAGEGDEASARLAREALDRWLMTRGHAQVFATQTVTPDFFGGEEDGRPCLWPVDPSFPAVHGRTVHGAGVETCPYPAKSDPDVVAPMLMLYSAVAAEDVFPRPRIKPRP